MIDLAFELFAAPGFSFLIALAHRLFAARDFGLLIDLAYNLITAFGFCFFGCSPLRFPYYSRQWFPY